MSILSLENVSFSYPNGVPALKDISLSFEAGEKVAIIGQNGAGKTTAVKLMNGLLKPTSGIVEVDGWNTKEHTTAQISSKVGYVFQNPDDQIFHDTILDEVRFSTRNLDISDEAKEKVVNEALELCNLADYKEMHPYSLPYSLRKFITIAAVIAMQTAVIIMDEPTAGQDRYALERLSTIMDQLVASGKTVIIITHDMPFVANNFEKVVAMANGSVVSKGLAADIFSDEAIIEQCHIQAPYVGQIAAHLGWPQSILTVDDFVKYAKKN